MISSDDESGPKTEIGAFKTETQDDENGTASRNSGKSPILVATDLASRGLDVKDIKWGQLSIASCGSFTLQGTNIYITYGRGNSCSQPTWLGEGVCWFPGGYVFDVLHASIWNWSGLVWRCVINYDFPNQIEDVRVCHVFLIQILSQSRMHIRNHIICHIPISFKYQITAFWIYMT